MLSTTTKKLVAYAFLAVVLLITNPVSAGTVTKSFPDLDAHVDMFFEFRLGMTQRAFRARVPLAWRIVPLHQTLKQNVNSRGEINRGWFKYLFVARGTRYPEMSFYFWEGRLVYAELNSHTNRRAEGQMHYDAGLRTAPKLRAKHGSVFRENIGQYQISPDWRSDDVEASLTGESVAHPVPWTQVCLTRRA